jgi:hypothetical protein
MRSVGKQDMNCSTMMIKSLAIRVLKEPVGLNKFKKTGYGSAYRGLDKVTFPFYF